jgi:hypothetical protein
MRALAERGTERIVAQQTECGSGALDSHAPNDSIPSTVGTTKDGFSAPSLAEVSSAKKVRLLRVLRVRNTCAPNDGCAPRRIRPSLRWNYSFTAQTWAYFVLTTRICRRIHAADEGKIRRRAAPSTAMRTSGRARRASGISCECGY